MVFDIGGAQNPVKGRTKNWDVKEYKILDLPEIDLDIYHDEWFADDVQGYPDAEFDDNYASKADAIFCLEVFEYLINPKQALDNIYDMLKHDGKAYITFPLCYPVHQEVEVDSLRFTETGIRRLAKAAGLKINNILYRRDKSGLLQSFYAADGMRAAKGFDHSIYGYIVEMSKV